MGVPVNRFDALSCSSNFLITHSMLIQYMLKQNIYHCLPKADLGLMPPPLLTFFFEDWFC